MPVALGRLITTIFPRIYARTYYATGVRARYVFLTTAAAVRRGGGAARAGLPPQRGDEGHPRCGVIHPRRGNRRSPRDSAGDKGVFPDGGHEGPGFGPSGRENWRLTSRRE